MHTLFYASCKYPRLSPRSSWSGIILLRRRGGNKLAALPWKQNAVHTRTNAHTGYLQHNQQHNHTRSTHTDLSTKNKKICHQVHGQTKEAHGKQSSLLQMDNLLFSDNGQALTRASIQTEEYFGIWIDAFVGGNIQRQIRQIFLSDAKFHKIMKA